MNTAVLTIFVIAVLIVAFLAFRAWGRPQP
jgi:hypothetical protein